MSTRTGLDAMAKRIPIIAPVGGVTDGRKLKDAK
jgi:hypothetical protein